MQKTAKQIEVLDRVKAAGGGLVFQERRRSGIARTVKALRAKVENLHYSQTACRVAVWLSPHPGYTWDAEMFCFVSNVDGQPAMAV